MTPHEELFALAQKLNEVAEIAESEEILQPINSLEKAAEEVGRAFSGSWLGYHSRVYYANLLPAPPGANFSQEWGLDDAHGMGSQGDWREFDPEFVKSHILKKAGEPDMDFVLKSSSSANDVFDETKSDIMSILEYEIENRDDKFLTQIKLELKDVKPMHPNDIIKHWSPRGQIMTRDMIAAGQRNQTPPHILPLAKVASIKHSFGICKIAADMSRKAASHVERKSRRFSATERVGTNVFIGHGQSETWRELKDFIQDRLNLPWDEFNRIPVAGVTNIARLSEMLDAAAIAFLVLTAEDEMADGALQARMNVVHEAGLFQGRLGFTKAIVLLEQGCEEFSNIQGLGQIRFPTGNISVAFEEIRRVLEREGLLNARR